VRVIIDEREPKEHPWIPCLFRGWQFERATLETGDLALAAMPEAAVIERKTASDLVVCMTSAEASKPLDVLHRMV
jgi:ERCC4-type nuclease